MKRLIRKWLGVDEAIERAEILEAKNAILEARLRDYHGRLCRAAQQPTHKAIVESLRELFAIAEAFQRKDSDQLGQAIIHNMQKELGVK